MKCQRIIQLAVLSLVVMLLTTDQGNTALLDQAAQPIAHQGSGNGGAPATASTDTGTNKSLTDTAYNAIKMVSASDGWIVGGSGLILRYQKGIWRSYAAPTTTDLGAVDATATEAWAVGGHTILHWSGGDWQEVSSPTPITATLIDVDIVAPGEAWAIGALNPPSNLPLMLHYVNGSWSLMPTPPSIGLMSWASPTDGWMVNSTERIYHYHEGAWSSQIVSLAGYYGVTAISVYMRSANDGWIGLSVPYCTYQGHPPIILHYDGNSWQPSTEHSSKPAAPDKGNTAWDTTPDLISFATSGYDALATFYVGDICIAGGDSATRINGTYSCAFAGSYGPCLNRLSGVADNDIWLINATSIYHWDGIQLSPITPCTTHYSDVPDSYYVANQIYYLTCHGIISGVGNNLFKPDDLVTRVQFAKLITLARGWQLTTPAGQTFTDVPPSNPLYTFVETAYAYGAIQGVDAGNCAIAHAVSPCFLPNQAVPRAQAALIVQRAFGWPNDTTGGPHFSDVPTDYYAYAAIETCYNRHIINGFDGHHFAPGGNITRSQIAKVLYSAMTQP